MKKRRTPRRPRKPEAGARRATVFVAGCFNRVHKAHLRTLRLAQALGGRLVVVLAHDSHNHKPNAVPARDRLRRLRALGVADRVVVGEAGSFAESLRRERPDILALGYDQRLPDAATEAAVRELGVRVTVLPWSPGKEEHHACQYVF
ncbi:MAG: adenylyltransferase/cytidyltransferase family protein [Elusimicrobia bacterium]|nr:adenylyltransferase/cytidyltransferase family protein [Elusimicrobiota bacterium]